MQSFFLKNSTAMAILIAIFLLIAHLFSWEGIVVDNTTIILLIIIFLSPLATQITKIKLGDFEAEIDPQKIKQIQENVLLNSDIPENYQNLPRIEKVINQINKLFEEDHIIALAKLRIEIERISNDIHTMILKNDRKTDAPIPLVKLIHEIYKQDIISEDIFHSVREVIDVCNKAVHGIEIKKADARIILDVGYNLLWQLASAIGDDEYLLEPLRTEVITQGIIDDYNTSQYQVTTITPLVNNPTKNIRILTQWELDDLLDGYNEYAEFIVDIRKINKS